MLNVDGESPLRSQTLGVLRPLVILFVFVAAFWAIEAFDYITLANDLDQYGIRPRDTDSLRNIFAAPFLHGSFSHVAANSVPFLVLGALIIWRSRRDFWLVTLITTVISGLGIWLVGGFNTVHIGASGIVFGFLGYLIFLGWFERSAIAIIQAIVVGAIYGGVLWSLFSFEEGVSWSGHLFGFIGGIVSAWLLARRSPSRPPNF